MTLANILWATSWAFWITVGAAALVGFAWLCIWLVEKGKE